MNKLKSISLLILIILVGLVGYYIGNNNKIVKNENKVILPTAAIINEATKVIEPTTIKQELLSYENKEKGFLLKYPKSVVFKENEDKSISFEIWGPSQKEDTEFYDGLAISLKALPLKGKTILEIVNENIKGSEEVWGETIDQAEKAILGGVEGLTYKAGNHQYYYLPLKNNLYLELLNFTQDPSNQGYIKMAEIIINSLIIQ